MAADREMPRGAIQPDDSAIADPALAALYRHWSALRSGPGFPHIDDIDPAEFGAARPHTLLVRILPDGDFLYEDSGGLVHALMNPTGLTLAEAIPPGAYHDHIRTQYQAALSGREAMSYRLVRIGILLVFVFLIACVLLFQALFTDLSGLGSGFGTQLFVTMATQLLLYAAFAMALWNAFTVWQSQQGWFAKLWSLVLAVAILIVILFAALNGLLSWETNF